MTAWSNILYLDIDSISPNCGSINGGTLLTIAGQGFGSVPKENAIIKVSGSPCNIEEITDNAIKCRTTKTNQQYLNRDHFPGMNNKYWFYRVFPNERFK